MKNLLSIKDLTAEEILSLIDLADEVKKDPVKFSMMLEGKCIVLLFQKTSTRTRISFESGMYQLGGNAIYLDWCTTNLHLGTLTDEIRCISSYVDLIMARVNKHQTLEVIQGSSNTPVINGLSDKYHPCQALADLMTVRETLGGLKNITIAWVGDGNNVCNSLIIGCVLLKIPIFVATPDEYSPLKEVINWVKEQELDKYLKMTNNPKEVVEDADVIYTDTFVSMGQEDEAEKRHRVFAPFQVNRELLNNANKDPYIMHCLPAHRGVEITDEIIDSEKSIIFEQAENRLHFQKALMLKLLRKSEF
jgi:ornithine carbamoyltransferase